MWWSTKINTVFVKMQESEFEKKCMFSLLVEENK